LDTFGSKPGSVGALARFFPLGYQLPETIIFGKENFGEFVDNEDLGGRGELMLEHKVARGKYG